MENLAAPYLFILTLIQDLESGTAARISAQNYLRIRDDEFTRDLGEWLRGIEQGMPQERLKKDSMSAFRRALFDLLDFSLQGVSVLDSLRALEGEMREVSEQQLENHLAKLPFKLMLPVLFLQFPALLLLILGPLVFHLIKEVQ